MAYRGFPKILLPALVCQKCHGELLSSTDEEFILSGSLSCPQCKESYKIEGGIVLMLPAQILDAVRLDEISVRDDTALAYDKRLAKRYHKEVISTLRAIGPVNGKLVIEHGAGTGRLTVEYAKNAKAILACDFSLTSLQILADKLNNETVGLICADSTTIVLGEQFFDVAIATQFFEHVPSGELRDSFLLQTKNALQNGGRFISTTYHFDLRMRLFHKAQEGKHWDQIFFHYYTVGELRDEYNKHFTICSLVPIDITLPLEARLLLPPKIGGLISRFFEHIPFIRNLGHLLLCVAIRK